MTSSFHTVDSVVSMHDTEECELRGGHGEPDPAQAELHRGHRVRRPPSHGGRVAKYRVFSKGRIDIGPPKSLIFWTFPGVLGFF